MNLYGPRQSAEKFIPNTIGKVLAGETVTIHASPDGVSGWRNWVDVRDLADAWLFLATRTPATYPQATRPDLFHIAGERKSNLDIAQAIAECLGKPLAYALDDYHSARPGHDLAYGLSGAKLASEGWKPQRPFEKSLEETVRWYVDHPSWLS